MLKKSCCCYSLQHGAVIIGITFMITSAVLVLMEVGLLAEWTDVQKSFRDLKSRQCKTILQ